MCRHEAIVIEKIVDAIYGRLFPLYSDVDEDLVGMQVRLADLKSQLKIGSGGVRMVGLWGLGGSGKTTLAFTVFREFSLYFEGQCIVDNIREQSSKLGLKTLQENILSTLLKTQVRVQNVEEGKHMIKSRLCHSNVLVLLDDVDDHDQLEALAGSHKWFGNGSRIIITTRNIHLLKKHKVDHISPVRLLSHDEATRLFNRHAYNEKTHIKNYEKLSEQVVSYTAGLPLALKVLGSFLYDKNEKEWTDTFVRLKDIPEMGIVEKLKISYDGLRSVEKELFLDIACFFRGKVIDDVIEILKACGFYPNIGITVLRQKALITVSQDGRFDMHDLVQEMGLYIVRGEHPNNPEKHSRIWKYKDLNDVCSGDAKALMKNAKIEAIYYYNYTYQSSHFCKTISYMKNLRLVNVTLDDDKDSDGPTFLSNELRYIYWKHYPASTFPLSFQPMKLVVLRLESSLQEKLWEGYKHLPQLKVLDLREVRNLLGTPDVSGLPYLKKLTLWNCDKLEEIHPSLGKHRSLKHVRVSYCRKLRTLPTIVHMDKLETLEIWYCHQNLEFPKIQANMNSLVKLSLKELGIQVLLSLIEECCPNLISLDLDHCFILNSIEVKFDGLKHLKELKYDNDRGYFIFTPRSEHLSIPLSLVFQLLTRSLRKLDLSGCLLEDGEIPSYIGELSGLQELDLSRNNFTLLDFSFSQLTQLKHLKLDDCSSLVGLPKLPSSIAILKADNCMSLTAIGDFQNCNFLCRVSIMNGGIVIDAYRLLQSMLQGNAIKNNCMVLRLEGLEIPKRFIPPLRDGSRCTLQLPENWCNDFSGFLLCAVSTDMYKSFIDLKISMEKVRGKESQDDMVWEESAGDEKTWLGYVTFGSLRNTRWWDETYNTLSFSIYIRSRGFGKSCSGFGVTLVPKETSTFKNSFEYSEEKEEYYTHKFKIDVDSTDYLLISTNIRFQL